MKKFLLLFLTFLFLSCSSNDDEAKREIPEKFDIKIEIKGKNIAPNVSIAINSSVVKAWKIIELPFTGEYTYYSSGSEVTNVTNACNCIEIASRAWLYTINEMEEFNLYVDGKLVDSTTITPNTVNNKVQPAQLEYKY